MNMYEYVEIRDVDILLESLISVLDSRTFRGLFLNTSSFREAVRESISQNRRGGKRWKCYDCSIHFFKSRSSSRYVVAVKRRHIAGSSKDDDYTRLVG